MSLESTARLNTLWGRLLVEELARCGVAFVCVSPGSRSTPLTAAVAGSGRLESAIWLDERGAAFHALGRARATGRPAALVCTSGTAVANYLPAVIEASQDGVPLVVVTADRPPELIDTGANQAIRQPGIFGDYVRWSFSLPAPDADISGRLVLSTVDQALHRALGPPAGPVHINCMFREPLEPVVVESWPDDIPRRWRQGSGPLTVYAHPEAAPDAESLERIAATITAARRGLVVIGSLFKERDREAAAALSEQLGWPVAADIRSGLRLGPGPANRVPCLDQILLSPQVRSSLTPDVVLHLGGRTISKRLAQALAALPDAAVISVREASLPRRPRTPRRNPRAIRHRTLLRIARRAHRPAHHGSRGCLGDAIARTFGAGGGVASTALSLRPPLARSRRHVSCRGRSPRATDCSWETACRSATWRCSRAPPARAYPVAANRGASGIDGIVASAAGFACGLGRPATLMIGDLSLLHDLNALVHLRALPQPLVIVVLNNRGGGIFQFLPIARHPELLDPWFTAPHDVGFSGIQGLFGIPCHCPASAAEFTAVYRAACASGAPAIIEVRTDRAENLAAHRALGEAIVAAVESP